jgi:hypothetical protein
MVQQDSGESRCSAIHGIRIFGGASEERDCSSGRCSRAEGEVGIKNETGHEADRPDQGGFVKKDPAERLVSEEHDRGAHIEQAIRADFPFLGDRYELPKTCMSSARAAITTLFSMEEEQPAK